MSKITNIISETSHRPYDLPKGEWVYYQEWNRAIFLHWKVPFEVLRELVPSRLNIDIFEGNCYVSLVMFTMEKIRPRYLPSVGIVSNFDEINLRTYIDNDNRKGVYFLNIEAGKSLSTFIARSISGLPYGKSKIERTAKRYSSINAKKGFGLDVEFEVKETIDNKSELDRWLTERYCLYLDSGNDLYRYDIHHKEWTLRNVDIKKLDINYMIGGIDLRKSPPLMSHYSDGIEVLAWKREEI